MKNFDLLKKEYEQLLLIENEMNAYFSKPKKSSKHKTDYYKQKYPNYYNGNLDEFYTRKDNLQINLNQLRYRNEKSK